MSSDDSSGSSASGGKKKKKPCLTRKKIFLDITIVEASNLVRPKSTTAFSWTNLLSLTGVPANSNNPSLYKCQVGFGLLSRSTNYVPNDCNPIWNEDCTFVYHFDEEEENMLCVCLFEKRTGMFGAETMTHEARISLEDFSFDQLHDISIECPFIGSEDILGPIPNLPKVHLFLYKSNSRNKGGSHLNYIGTPTSLLPLRLDAGDIIAVSSSYFLTHGIKLTTMSKWDHVAIVIRHPNHKRLKVLEATMEGGVTCTNLKPWLKSWVSHSTVAIRRLRFLRTDEILQKLSEFVEEVEGKPYRTNVWDFMKAGLKSHTEDNVSSFFCSQLVALGLQRIGILSSSVCASNILPFYFEGPMDLTPGSKASNLAIFPPNPLLDSDNEDEADVDQNGTQAEAELDEDDLAEGDFEVLSTSPTGSLSPRAQTVLGINVVNTTSEVDSHGKRYTKYILKVETNSGTYCISKRYSQFTWLDAEMKRRFSGLYKLPPKAVNKKVTPSIIAAREKALETYLQLLLDHQCTRNCRPLIEFLSPSSFVLQKIDGVVSESEEELNLAPKTKPLKKSKRSSKTSSSSSSSSSSPVSKSSSSSSSKSTKIRDQKSELRSPRTFSLFPSPPASPDSQTDSGEARPVSPVLPLPSSAPSSPILFPSSPSELQGDLSSSVPVPLIGSAASDCEPTPSSEDLSCYPTLLYQLDSLPF